MRSLKEIKAKLGPQASRKGLCNSPHPNPKYEEEVMVPHPEGKRLKAPGGGLGELIYVPGVAVTVKCSRFKYHDDDCSAYAFSIGKPDTWPKPDGWDDES